MLEAFKYVEVMQHTFVSKNAICPFNIVVTEQPTLFNYIKRELHFSHKKTKSIHRLFLEIISLSVSNKFSV